MATHRVPREPTTPRAAPAAASASARAAGRIQESASLVSLARSLLSISKLLQVGSSAVDPRIEQRIAALTPCWEAQQQAADLGIPAHTSSGLVAPDVHVMGTAAKHEFRKGLDFLQLTPAQARRARRSATRGARLSSISSFKLSPSAASFLPTADVGAIHHGAGDSLLLSESLDMPVSIASSVVSSAHSPRITDNVDLLPVPYFDQDVVFHDIVDTPPFIATSGDSLANSSIHVDSLDITSHASSDLNVEFHDCVGTPAVIDHTPVAIDTPTPFRFNTSAPILPSTPIDLEGMFGAAASAAAIANFNAMTTNNGTWRPPPIVARPRLSFDQQLDPTGLFRTGITGSPVAGDGPEVQAFHDVVRARSRLGRNQG